MGAPHQRLCEQVRGRATGKSDWIYQTLRQNDLCAANRDFDVDAAGASMNEMKASRPFQPALLLLAAFAVYGLLWPAVPGDINNFLIPWLDHIVARGPVGAFAMPFSNYTPPYLYLLTLISPLAAVMPKVSVIKLLSVAGTLLLALTVRHLMRSSVSAGRRDAWLWLMLLPSVAVNAANFGQCDAIWSAACVMAVASAVSDRPFAMLVWFGIAISFKAQGLFLGPFIALRLVQERTPLAMWGVPIAIYVLSCCLQRSLVGRWLTWRPSTCVRPSGTRIS